LRKRASSIRPISTALLLPGVVAETTPFGAMATCEASEGIVIPG